jgi:mono/diheme cytochrome c family protein
MDLLGWRVSAIAGLCGLVVVVSSCGGRRPTPPPGLTEVQLAGWQAYIDLNCASCHGVDREGKRSGPALTGLGRYWTADKLVSYLTDPDAMVKADTRLAYKAEKFAIGMPGHSGKSPGYENKARAEKLRALAEYLLIDPPPQGR